MPGALGCSGKVARAPFVKAKVTHLNSPTRRKCVGFKRVTNHKVRRSVSLTALGPATHGLCYPPLTTFPHCKLSPAYQRFGCSFLRRRLDVGCST